MIYVLIQHYKSHPSKEEVSDVDRVLYVSIKIYTSEINWVVFIEKTTVELLYRVL